MSDNAIRRAGAPAAISSIASRDLSDLARCDQEPIRTPGAIQPLGRLLALDPDTLALAAFSENWEHAASLRASRCHEG